MTSRRNDATMIPNNLPPTVPPVVVSVVTLETIESDRTIATTIPPAPVTTSARWMNRMTDDSMSNKWNVVWAEAKLSIPTVGPSASVSIATTGRSSSSSTAAAASNENTLAQNFTKPQHCRQSTYSKRDDNTEEEIQVEGICFTSLPIISITDGVPIVDANIPEQQNECIRNNRLKPNNNHNNDKNRDNNDDGNCAISNSNNIRTSTNIVRGDTLQIKSQSEISKQNPKEQQNHQYSTTGESSSSVGTDPKLDASKVDDSNNSSPVSPLWTSSVLDLVFGMPLALSAVVCTALLEPIASIFYFTASLCYSGADVCYKKNQNALCRVLWIYVSCSFTLIFGNLILLDICTLTVSETVTNLFASVAFVLTFLSGGYAKALLWYLYVHRICHLYKWAWRSEMHFSDRCKQQSPGRYYAVLPKDLPASTPPTTTATKDDETKSSSSLSSNTPPTHALTSKPETAVVMSSTCGMNLENFSSNTPGSGGSLLGTNVLKERNIPNNRISFNGNQVHKRLPHNDTSDLEKGGGKESALTLATGHDRSNRLDQSDPVHHRHCTKANTNTCVNPEIIIMIDPDEDCNINYKENSQMQEV